MPLSPADLSTLSRLLDEAQELAPGQLEAWLSALPAGDRAAAQHHADQARAAFAVQPGVSPYYKRKRPLARLESALAKSTRP